MKKLFKLVLLIALLGIIAAVLILRDAHSVLQQPLNITQNQTYEIALGGNLKSITRDLHARGLAPNARLPLYLRLYGRITGLANRLQAGEYRLTPGLSGLDLLRMFVSGKVMQHPLLLLEGASAEQFIAAVAQHPKLIHPLGAATPEQVMSALGHAGVHPEGRFFPDTYLFPSGASELSVLKLAFETMQSVLASEWQQRDQDLPYANMDEALIMASIIEKETGVAAERAEIAAVFVNRLRLSMKLQTDPTVIYGMGQNFDGNLRKQDLTTDSPYNTYMRSGLPPTPICLPGRAAIHAALHPAQSKYLYFVGRGDGTHVFSETLVAHNAAVDRYQKKLRAPQN